MTVRQRSWMMVASAMALGAVAGVLLTRRHHTEYKFLEGAKTIAVEDASVQTSNGVVRGTTTFFTFAEDWHKVWERAKAEIPEAIVRDAMVGGHPAKILTIPRVEDGRLRLFFPPVCEITVLSERLALSEGGQVMPVETGDANWSSVKISEYRQPHMLDNTVDWLRNRLNI